MVNILLLILIIQNNIIKLYSQVLKCEKKTHRKVKNNNYKYLYTVYYIYLYK